MASSEDIDSFIAITGANGTAAERMLELCGGELEQAIQLWFSDEDLQQSMSNAGPSAATASASRSSGPSHPPLGREDEQGIIHLDSDDDVPMTEDQPDDADEAAAIARRAQEEEDAALAKRMQEELYGSGPAGREDGVRAPMGRVTETLVGQSYDPGDDDGHAAVMEQLRRRQQATSRLDNNPFAQSVWEEPARPSRHSPLGEAEPTRASRLAELFRPPYDLMSHLSWDEAREEGKDSKKWILVNLQDASDFNCQALNRDVWKDVAVKALVKENFIFIQYEKNDFAAEQYVTFYLPNEGHLNPNNFPHVAIIDPRTGEQVKVWSGIPFPKPLEFHAQLVEFLDRYSLSINAKNPVSTVKRSQRVVDVDRMTEEEMLELALQNSLDANGGPSHPNVHDPDELTKSTDGLTGSKGKEKAEAAESAGAEVEPSPAQESAFSKIPSDLPHEEPAADPNTTTRLQVRNPPGRIIRRFRLDDRVVRIYEWLKAEPLPGKEGVPFELKSMPQGKDLIEQLDMTIQEAGLANGTVMLEFIEE